MVSQKAAALAKYTKAKRSDIVYSPWNTLTTETMEFNPSPEGIDLNDDYIQLMRDEINDTVSSTVDRLTNGYGRYPYFVRACPVQPRPGVLESSVAHDDAELIETLTRIATKMLSKEESDSPMYEHGFVEPEGCIIIQKYIDADASAVVAPNSYIFIGRDNDGITAGKDGVKVAIPHVSDNATTDTLSTLGIDPSKIELEFVSMLTGSMPLHSRMRESHAVEHDSYIVQLRGSSGHTPISPPPAGVTINGIIPQGTVKVTHIHLVTDGGDEQLVLMEALIRNSPDEGTVVIFPTGSHMSHHAGQCRKYKVPFIVSDTVTVGSTWKEVASGWVTDDPAFEPKPYNPYQYVNNYIDGINVGMNHFARQHGWLSTQFHQFIGGPLTDVADTAFYGGVFTGWLVGATMSVGMGEMRHAPSCRSKNTPLIPAVLHGLYNDSWEESDNKSLSSNRKHYYTAVENTPVTIDSVIAQLGWLKKMYSTNWTSGYGGTNYANSCLNAKNLATAIKVLIKKPTEANLMDVIGQANMTENNIHNTSFFFNKFLSKTPLDWGTDPKKVTLNPADFFRVWYAAKDASEHKGVSVELRDTTHIIKYANKQSIQGLREDPIFLRTDLPDEMYGASKLSSYWSSMIHSGTYGNTGDAFIPCGAEQCEHCASVVLMNIGKNIPKLPSIGKFLDMDFPTMESEGELTYTTKDMDKHLMMAQELKDEATLQAIEMEPELYFGMALELLNVNMKDAYPYTYANKILKRLALFMERVKNDTQTYKAFAEYCTEE